jgi:hypothetical protein
VTGSFDPSGYYTITSTSGTNITVTAATGQGNSTYSSGGHISIAQITNYDYSTFVTIAEDPNNPGATIDTLNLNVGKVAFRNLTIEHLNPHLDQIASSSPYDNIAGLISLHVNSPVPWTSPADIGVPVRLSALNGTGNYQQFEAQYFTITAISGTTITLNAGAGLGSGIAFTSGTVAEPAVTPYGDRSFLVKNTAYSQNTFFDNLKIKSAEDSTVNSWSMLTAQNNAASAFDNETTNCTTISHTTISNVTTGILTGDNTNVLLTNDKIDRTFGDGVDYADVHALYLNLDILNGLDNANGLHWDCLQGEPDANGGGSLIEIAYDTCMPFQDGTNWTRCLGSSLANTCAKTAQGIDLFDGVYTYMYVHHSVSIVNEGDAFAFYGVQHLLLDHDFASFNDGRSVWCPYPNDNDWGNCSSVAGIRYQGDTAPGIVITHSKLAVPSSDITITNSYFSDLSLDIDTGSWTASGNICWQPGNVGYPGSVNISCTVNWPEFPATISSAVYTQITKHLVVTLTAPVPAQYTNGLQLYFYGLTGDCATGLNLSAGSIVGTPSGNTMTLVMDRSVACTGLTGGTSVYQNYANASNITYAPIGTFISPQTPAQGPSYYVKTYDTTTPSYNLNPGP